MPVMAMVMMPAARARFRCARARAPAFARECRLGRADQDESEESDGGGEPRAGGAAHAGKGCFNAYSNAGRIAPFERQRTRDERVRAGEAIPYARNNEYTSPGATER